MRSPWWPRSRPRLIPGLVLLAAAVALAGCRGESGASTGAELAERWLRLGEDVGTGVVVYEAALPPTFSDLLNPTADEETPEEDLIRLPVHPTGDLLGSYVLRRPDGSHLLWLFYDVPEAEVGGVTGEVALQLDESPWQVVGQQGSRAYTVVQFQSTRGDDLTGTAIIEPAAATEEYEVVVDREGDEVTLQVERAAAMPVLEAELEDDLTVASVQPGMARAAGLQEGDRILRVGETDVSTVEDLERALVALGQGVGPVSVTYLVQVAPARAAEPATYVPGESLALPADFPLRPAFEQMVVDQYQTFLDPAGDFFGASLLTQDSASDVAGQMREALTADNWEIVSDEPVGFATALQFMNSDGTLQGSMQIDLFAEDESFTQVVVQIQTAAPGG